MKLTAIVLAGSGGDSIKLRRAVKSVEFADEVMVMKNKAPVKDFSAVRNQVLRKAKHDWVLFVDADEEVTPELAWEIRQVLEKPKTEGQKLEVAFYLRRRDKFLGQWLKHGETAAVRLVRLARKKAGKWERPVHEVWQVTTPIEEFKNPLFHYSHERVEEMAQKINRYTEIEAGYKKEQARILLNRDLVQWWFCFQMVVWPAGKFCLNYFWRRGFLDGMPGFIQAIMMSWHSFLVRAKMVTSIQYLVTR